QKLDLGILATEAEYGGASHVGMMNVSSQQAGKVPGICAGAAAAAFMSEKLDAVKVGKNLALLTAIVSLAAPILKKAAAARPMSPDQIGYLTPVDLRRRISQLFFKRLFQDSGVSVFAEHQRNHQPVIARSHLAIRAVVSEDRRLLPARDIRRGPVMGFS